MAPPGDVDQSRPVPDSGRMEVRRSLHQADAVLAHLLPRVQQYLRTSGQMLRVPAMHPPPRPCRGHVPLAAPGTPQRHGDSPQPCDIQPRAHQVLLPQHRKPAPVTPYDRPSPLVTRPFSSVTAAQPQRPARPDPGRSLWREAGSQREDGQCSPVLAVRAHRSTPPAALARVGSVTGGHHNGAVGLGDVLSPSLIHSSSWASCGRYPARSPRWRIGPACRALGAGVSAGSPVGCLRCGNARSAPC